MGCLGSKEAKYQPKQNKTQNGSTGTGAAEQSNKTEAAVNGTNVDEKYDVGEEIGRGAFSIVKKATEKATGKHWAVKFIEKKFVDKNDLQLLAREIEIMKRVDHDNVLKLKEVFENDDTIALVMELVNGGELFYKIVEKGNYSESDAAAIVRQIVSGVAYLHSQGIAHRDLKPENLLCSEGNPDYKPFRVVIADFGLSKNFVGGEQLETSCGTPDYVAPEVITAEGSYDNSVDMWSVGVITYVLLCGFSPFLSSTQAGLFEKIIRCEYDFPDPEWTNISDNAKDFIRQLLVKDPHTRYTAKQCSEHAWLQGKTTGETDAAVGLNLKKYNAERRATKKVLGQ